MDENIKTKLQNLHPTLDYSNTTIHHNSKTYRKSLTGVYCNVCKTTFDLPNLSRHLNSPFQGCKNCSKIKQTERKRGPKIDIYKNLSEIHPEYIFCIDPTLTTRDKVSVLCKKHGVFSTTVDSLLYKKSKCPTCAQELNGFNKSVFRRRCTKNGTLYVIEILEEDHTFYKVGITSNTIKNRYSSLPYKYKVIRELKGDPDLIWELEYSCKQLITTKYEPKIKFNGCRTEVFLVEDLEIILETIDTKKNTYTVSTKPTKTYLEAFIERVKPRHTTEYDYSKCIWVDKNTKLEIICPVHGSFFQLPRNHLQGFGCQSCGKLKAIRKKKQCGDE